MSNFQYFGHLGGVDTPLAFFQEQNYIVCRGATDLAKIDDLVKFYESWVVNSQKKYLRQSTRWEYNQKTSVGGVKNCWLNPHSFERGRNAEFSDKILSVLSDPCIQKALAEINRKKANFQLFQTMLFDHSTTGPHQDWIYLDSRPNGHLST